MADAKDIQPLVCHNGTGMVEVKQHCQWREKPVRSLCEYICSCTRQSHVLNLPSQLMKKVSKMQIS